MESFCLQWCCRSIGVVWRPSWTIRLSLRWRLPTQPDVTVTLFSRLHPWSWTRGCWYQAAVMGVSRCGSSKRAIYARNYRWYQEAAAEMAPSKCWRRKLFIMRSSPFVLMYIHIYKAKPEKYWICHCTGWFDLILLSIDQVDVYWLLSERYIYVKCKQYMQQLLHVVIIWTEYFLLSGVKKKKNCYMRSKKKAMFEGLLSSKANF